MSARVQHLSKITQNIAKTINSEDLASYEALGESSSKQMRQDILQQILLAEKSDDQLLKAQSLPHVVAKQAGRLANLQRIARGALDTGR